MAVVTPGGGGDKISYQPYRDIETAFYKMLTNVFGNVTKLKTPKDADAISRRQNVRFRDLLSEQRINQGRFAGFDFTDDNEQEWFTNVREHSVQTIQFRTGTSQFGSEF